MWPPKVPCGGWFIWKDFSLQKKVDYDFKKMWMVLGLWDFTPLKKPKPRKCLWTGSCVRVGFQMGFSHSPWPREMAWALELSLSSTVTVVSRSGAPGRILVDLWYSTTNNYFRPNSGLLSTNSSRANESIEEKKQHCTENWIWVALAGTDMTTLDCVVSSRNEKSPGHILTHQNNPPLILGDWGAFRRGSEVLMGKFALTFNGF